MKILVVDDSKAMRMLILRALEQAGLGHHTFLQAADGFEAFTLVTNESPDLVLSDWTMSGVGGMDLLRGLRGAGNAVPFGFITAQASEARREEALTAGAQFIVGKPFLAQSLADVVREYVDG
jgi:two-component system chemotaxis response regulator CheY